MVGALRDGRDTPRGVVAATVLGGLAPDADAVLMALGWDVYLRWHEVGTHALAGSLVAALLPAVLVRTWAPATAFGSLLLGAWLGALSHVAFDLYSGATIAVLWPLSSHVFATPVVAMADPLAIVALLIGAFALWLWPRASRLAGTLSVALLALLCVAKLTTRAWATDAYTSAHAPAAVESTAREAAWGSWAEWLFFDRSADGTIRALAVNGWSGDVRERFVVPAAGDAGAARASVAQFATVRNFLPTHPYAFATTRITDEGAVVFWSDARFCWASSERPDPQAGVPHQDVRPATGPVHCGLWFGGSLDAAGRPREALVWLGGHLQRRAPQRW